MVYGVVCWVRFSDLLGRFLFGVARMVVAVVATAVGWVGYYGAEWVSTTAETIYRVVPAPALVESLRRSRFSLGSKISTLADASVNFRVPRKQIILWGSFGASGSMKNARWIPRARPAVRRVGVVKG